MVETAVAVYGRIYLVENIVNGKRYVGQTTGSIAARWRVHCTARSQCRALSAAIEKYGVDLFVITEICAAGTRAQLNELEQFYVEKLGALAPQGYNLREGGGSKGRWSEEMLAKIRARSSDPEYVSKMHSAAVEMWRRPDTRRKIADAIKKGLANPEVKERRSRIAKERALDPQVKERMSAGQNMRFSNPCERARVGASTQQRMQDPEYKAKVVAASTAAKQDPKHREKVSLSMRELWKNPEYAARIRAAQLAGKARKKALASQHAVEQGARIL